MKDIREYILYSTRQDILHILIVFLFLGLVLLLPLTVVVYFFLDFSLSGTLSFFLLLSILLATHLLTQWSNSWVHISNEKIIYSLWHGIFSHSFGSLAYEEIDQIWVKYEYAFMERMYTLVLQKHDGISIRIPHLLKWKEISSIIRTLSEYTFDERSTIHSVRGLHEFRREKIQWA